MRRRGRLLTWGLFVGGLAAVLAPIGPGALIPLKMAIASADSVGNDVYVAVVVDFGSGSSMSSISKCVPVASSAHDSDALAAAMGAGDATEVVRIAHIIKGGCGMVGLSGAQEAAARLETGNQHGTWPKDLLQLHFALGKLQGILEKGLL